MYVQVTRTQFYNSVNHTPVYICNYCCMHYVVTNVMPTDATPDCDYCGVSAWLNKEIQKLHARIIELEQEIDTIETIASYKLDTAIDFIDTLSSACMDMNYKLGRTQRHGFGIFDIHKEDLNNEI